MYIMRYSALVFVVMFSYKSSYDWLSGCRWVFYVTLWSLLSLSLAFSFAFIPIFTLFMLLTLCMNMPVIPFSIDFDKRQARKRSKGISPAILAEKLATSKSWLSFDTTCSSSLLPPRLPQKTRIPPSSAAVLMLLLYHQSVDCIYIVNTRLSGKANLYGYMHKNQYIYYL